MKRTLVKDALGSNQIGQEIKVQGFVESIRNQKYVQFVVLRDPSGQMQIVNEKTPQNQNLTRTISSLTPESTVSIIGTVVEAPKAKLGGVELKIRSIDVHSIATAPLPITEDSSPEKRTDFRQLSLRSEKDQTIFQVQTTAEAAMFEFWKDEGFTIMHSPKLMGTPSESGAEVFEVKYFDKKAYLAQSPQFYKQLAIAGGIEKYAEIGPVFRADPSSTTRHNSEFTGVDMEVAWIDGYEDIMDLEERFLSHTFKAVAGAHKDQIKRVFGVDFEPPTLPFPRVTLVEAKELLATKGHILSDNDDLDPAAERLLGKHFKEETGSDFFFATEYPANVRAFYHMRDEARPNITKSFDLVYKGLEITTGAQREHRVDRLRAQAIERGLNPKELDGYFNFFSYGVPPHGGCGIGMGRLLSGMLGLNGVTPVTFLPRTMTRLTP